MNASAYDDQLSQFREAYARLDPSKPIQQSVEHPWYVERPDGLSRVVAGSLQIDPTSAHLLVGSIGCGKSTELLAIGRVLRETRGIFPHYVEVSQHMELAGASADQLVLALLDELIEGLFDGDKHLKLLQKQIRPDIGGYWLDNWEMMEQAEEEERRSTEGTYIPPRLTRPRQVTPALEPLVSHLTVLRARVAENTGEQLVWLIDGLDRITDPVAFDQIIDPFLKAIRAAGIGVAVVGPRRMVSGVDRLGVAEVFEERHMIRAVDPATTTGFKFLNQVLKSRGTTDVLPKDVADTLIWQSGGAVRVLLQIARQTIKEAWISNAESAGLKQAAIAADKTGRALLLGLSDADVRVLSDLLSIEKFGARAPEDAALVLTNRILEYQTERGLPRYVVHPTLIPFIQTATHE
jgi:energy-coupling factor transporter ATP-binding protein EcfA2